MGQITPSQLSSLAWRAFNKASDMILIARVSTGQFVMCNEATCLKTGYSLAELQQMHVWDLEADLPLRSVEDWVAKAKIMFHTDKITSVDGTHRRKDGSTYPAHVEIVLEVVDGEEFFMAVASDISDRLKASAELLEAHNWLERAQVFAKLGTWHIDLETEVISWSPEVFQSFGLSPDGPAPSSMRAFQEMLHPDDRQPLQRALDKVIGMAQIGGSRSGELEIRHRLPDGSYRWFLIRAEGILDVASGRVRHVYGISFDIHQRKMAEQQAKEQELRRLADQEEALEKERALNEILTKLNADLDSFVYSVSHDLRSPIASMTGLVRLARMARSQEEREQLFDMQERSLQKMDNFVKDILDYSRNTKAEVVPEPINWSVFLAEVLEQHAFNAQENGVGLYCNATQYSPFFSDRFRLSVVLGNLISNSIRYCDKSKTERFVQLFMEEELPGTALIKVIDNGIGIAQEHQQRVFEMFYRANDRIAGTGLGLYLVKDTIDKLQGKISLHSVYGAGTEISFSLPSLK